MPVEDAVKAYKPLEAVGENIDKIVGYIADSITKDIRGGYTKMSQVEEETFTIRVGNQVFGVQIPELKADEYGDGIDVYIDAGGTQDSQLGTLFPERYVEVWPIGGINPDGSVTTIDGKNAGVWTEYQSKGSKIADGVSFGKPRKPKAR